MEKKLYIIKDNVLISVMEMGTYSIAAPSGSRTFMGNEHEFAALKNKEGIDTTAWDSENSDDVENVEFEEIEE